MKKESEKKRKAPKLSKFTKIRNEYIGKEIKKILEAGGTKEVVVRKTVYKTDPKKAMKEAVKRANKVFVKPRK